ncbi:MAG TPA: hypothetical protein VJJ02_05135 [Candidatus Paceibacterota bacterium]
MRSPYPSAAKLESLLSSKKEAYWQGRGERMALSLFREMGKRVPAYKKFLAANNIDSSRIKKWEDLTVVPPIDKNNYLCRYPLHELCWDGDLAGGQYNISATSGSTGEPFYFPRTEEQDEQYALLAELYLRTNFSVHKRKTLYINAFPMGIWIGGLFTYATIRKIAERTGYPLSIVNPGIHKEEILKIVKKLGGEFEQILIGGYGPFVKDIIDDGIRDGINWKGFRLGFIFSAEGFTEDFRDYVVRKTGVDPAFGTLNHYGTVDLGTMSYETPFAIAVRRIALRNKMLKRSLFGQEGKVPTLTQFIPELFFFEERGGDLFCSARSGLPLFRYDLKDRGNVYTMKELLEKGDKLSLSLFDETKKKGVPKKTIWNLPFVQVFERSDFSVSFFAFQIYPEVIRRALDGLENDFLTGKFSLQSTFSKKGRPELIIHVELRPHAHAGVLLAKKIRTCIIAQLLKESSEYRETFKEKGVAIFPSIHLLPYEDLRYFKPGTKQKWTIK